MVDELGAGRVFEVETIIYSNGDHAETRWVVVVQPPEGPTDLIGVVQRSSTVFDGIGCDSSMDSLTCFSKEGRWVFKYHRLVAADLFVPAITHRCGELPEPERTNLLTAWEQY